MFSAIVTETAPASAAPLDILIETATDAVSDVIIDVAEQLRAKPAKADPVAKVNKLVAGMSDADKAALIEKLLSELPDTGDESDAS